MALRKFYPTKVEFGLSSNGTTAPSSWTEIPEAVLFDVGDADIQQFETAQRYQLFLSSRIVYTVGSTDVTGAWVSTLRGHQNSNALRIWLRITHAGGQQETLKNCNVQVTAEPARPDRPAMIMARFIVPDIDGSSIVFS